MKPQTLPQTEMPREDAVGLDLRSDEDILKHLLNAQKAALSALDTGLEAISRAANLMAATIREGGDLHYVAAGSSGLMGLADSAELPGTYGIPPNRIHICMAGGVPVDADMPGDTEDDENSARQAARNVRPGDCVIAISASGSTAYTAKFTDISGQAGARIIAIANNPGAALFNGAHCAVLVKTPPEIIAGSTRLGAATAQKVALNMMSTLMGIRLGHVHDGHMVNVVADNRKLQQRAARIVQHITGVSNATARSKLAQTSGHVKHAVLLAAGATGLEQARQILEQSDGRLRDALTRL